MNNTKFIVKELQHAIDPGSKHLLYWLID